jgi:acyl-CoA dehydrogenase
MRLDLSPEHAELRTALRAFTRTKLDPIAAEMDRTGEVPDSAIPLLREHGYLGMTLPTEYGGGGVDVGTYCLTLEEFSRSHRMFTLLLDYSTGLCPVGILRFGTDAQKRRWIPGLVSGDLRAAFALTEPEAGSDSAAIRTRAERRPGGWAINGRKHYISGGHNADVLLVIAVTDPEKRARGGISAFLVPRGTPGFTVTRIDQTIGSDVVRLGELTFEDCIVPDDALLGAEGDGFRIAMSSLVNGRLGVASSCIGAADKLLDMSVEHAKSRVTFGKPLAERQAIQWMLADSAVELELGRAYLYETLRRVAAGEDVGSAASMCKLYCTEMAGRVADRAVQIHGGMGLVRSYTVERFFRDLRHYRVGEGSSEVQRMLIARELLK